MIDWFKKVFSGLLGDWFGKKEVKLGLYGPPNSGKTTLANRICKDWLGKDQEIGTVSAIPHETREVVVKESVKIENADGKELSFNLVDTPGIATRIDFEDFMKKGMSQKKAKKRAREATKGVIDSIEELTSS